VVAHVGFLGGGTLKFMALSFSNAAKVAGGEDIEVNQIPFARSFVFDTNDPSIQDRRYYGHVSQFGAAEHIYSTAATPEVRTKALRNNPFLRNRDAINKLMQEVHETRKKEDTAKDPLVKKQLAEKR